MKLCTFLEKKSHTKRAGLVVSGVIYDIASCIKHLGKQGGLDVDYSTVLGILIGGVPAMSRIRLLDKEIGKKGVDSQFMHYSVPIGKTTLFAPVPRPNSIRDFMVFEEHLINATHTMAGWVFPPVQWANSFFRTAFRRPLLKPPKVWYQFPVYYKGNPDSVIGPGEDIRWPSFAEKLDYELEFGVYILKQGRDISLENAHDYIAGYTIFNDVSARDIQFKEMAARLGPAKSKDFDTGNVMGPFLNNEPWSRGSSSSMSFSFEEMIEYVSRSETIHPGDFFGSGTVGTGCGLELNRWIKQGDTVRLRIEGLGELENKVVRDEHIRGNTM
jgi:2-keto-4-pentenoate hydratase/2-oxohepta-3-ene-1,7-dioic acid hydratase in catechol pathway